MGIEWILMHPFDDAKSIKATKKLLVTGDYFLICVRLELDYVQSDLGHDHVLTSNTSIIH